MEDSEDKSEERGAWDNKLQFLMSCISLSVGLGNVWRFPYLVQKHGGGAFLIPYLIMMLVEGVPLFLLELGIGQKLRLGSLGVWNRVHPWTAGIGITATITSFLVGLYYNVVVCWCFYYLFNSFSDPLPFGAGGQGDNSSTEIFWYRDVQQASGSIDDLGQVNWKLALCLLLAWIIVYLSIMRGVQSSGKLMYFTAIFPYIILLSILCRALMLDGSFRGIKQLFTPELSKLGESDVWMAAATQVFYSLGLGFGSLIAFASYNPVKNNCKNDAIFMSAITVFTALFASIDIFAVLGHKAFVKQAECQLSALCNETGIFCATPVADYIANQTSRNLDAYVRESSQFNQCDQVFDTYLNGSKFEGSGLAFIVFTEAIMLLPYQQVWSVCFFLMLLALGLGSQFGTMEGVITNLFDMNVKIRKEFLTAGVCLVSFFIGILFVTKAGSYWVGLFDDFAGTFGLVMVGLFELIVISYVYGHKQFSDDVEMMTGSRPGWYWQIMWRFLSPLLITVIIVFKIHRLVTTPQVYSVWNDEQMVTSDAAYPTAVIAFTAILVVLTIAPLPVVFLVRKFQCVRVDFDVRPATIRRVNTTLSTIDMVGEENVSPEPEHQKGKYTRRDTE